MMASLERRAGWAIGIAVAIGVVIGLALTLDRRQRQLEFTLVFENAEGLRPGDQVQLNGVAIGHVADVRLRHEPTRVEVDVRIDREHAPMIRSDATGLIRGATPLNVSGQKIVEVLNPEGGPPVEPMPNGRVVEGLDGAIELQAWRLRQALRRTTGELRERLNALREQAAQAQQALQELASSPEVQAALAELRDLAAELPQRSREAAAELQQRFERLNARLQPLLEDLRRTDRRQAYEWLTRLLDEIRQALAEWRAMPGAGAATTTTLPAR